LDEAAAAAGISAVTANAEGAEAKAPVSPAAALTPAEQESPAVQQAQQTQQAQTAGHSFSLELAQAWRRQVEEKVRSDQTYDRGGMVGAGGSRTRAAQEASPSAETNAGQAAGAAEAASSPQPGGNAQQTHAPASRMRQAIGAYLACARNFSAVAPMLTAVA